MQCAGMIGEAVGRTRFRSDGLAMMSTLMVRIPAICSLQEAPSFATGLLLACLTLGARTTSAPIRTEDAVFPSDVLGSTRQPVLHEHSRSTLLSFTSCRQERLGKGGGLDGHEHFVFEHVAPACANLCRALGEDFAMFLPVVLPPLLTALEAEVKFNMEAADPDEDGEVRLAGGALRVSLR